MDARKLLLAAATLAFFSSFNSTPASTQTVSLNAVLLGANECDGIAPTAGPKCRKGDTDGFGLAGITFPAPGMLCVTLQVDNLANPPSSLAHIHLGQATFNGAILVTLPPPVNPGFGNPGVSAGCIAVAAATIGAIRANPGNYYINVHNSTFPAGAIRGQLF